jgi:hypothetical protein
MPVIINPQRSADEFYSYVTEAGLEWVEYRELLDPRVKKILPTQAKAKLIEFIQQAKTKYCNAAKGALSLKQSPTDSGSVDRDANVGDGLIGNLTQGLQCNDQLSAAAQECTGLHESKSTHPEKTTAINHLKLQLRKEIAKKCEDLVVVSLSECEAFEKEVQVKCE